MKIEEGNIKKGGLGSKPNSKRPEPPKPRIIRENIMPKTIKMSHKDDVKIARKIMWSAFKKDPDFAESYKAQISCFIMDNFPGYKKNKEKRDKLANELFNKIYKEGK